MEFTSIPILDYTLTTSPSTKPTFLSDLRTAILNVGFFYLQNAPISNKTQTEFVSKGIELFGLPLSKKLEMEMVKSRHFLGYSRLGAEVTARRGDWREQFDVSFLSCSFLSFFLFLPWHWGYWLNTY